MKIPFLGGIGVPELIIILIVVLLIFGPKNLPKLGNAIGKTFKSMRDGMEGKKKKDAPEDTQDSASDGKEDAGTPAKQVEAQVDESEDKEPEDASKDSEEKKAEATKAE